MTEPMQECPRCDGTGVVEELNSFGETVASHDCPDCTSLASPPVAPGPSEALREMEEQKDAAYLERNQVVAALAKVVLLNGGVAGIKRTAIEGWSDDWHGCVYIDTPWGQASWHYHDSQAHLFADLPAYAGEWDGHTTEQKYERLAARSHPSVSGTPERGEGVREAEYPRGVVVRARDDNNAGTLMGIIDEDGDAHLTIISDGPGQSVEFCTNRGGGRNPEFTAIVRRFIYDISRAALSGSPAQEGK